LREHLEVVEKRTGQRSKKLTAAEPPPDGAYLWDVFWELFDGSALTFFEIAAWSSLTGVEPTAVEARALRAMSAAALEEIRNGRDRAPRDRGR
jgi:hypothetical protein